MTSLLELGTSVRIVTRLPRRAARRMTLERWWFPPQDLPEPFGGKGLHELRQETLGNPSADADLHRRPACRIEISTEYLIPQYEVFAVVGVALGQHPGVMPSM